MQLGQEVRQWDDAMKLVWQSIQVANLDLDFESLSDGKKWHAEALNNWAINRIIDETRVAKESILD